MTNVYYSPEQHGLEVFAQISWDDEPNQFDLTTVWRCPDGAFVYADDSGCSCPSPYENLKAEDLIPITSLAEFQRHLDEYGGVQDKAAALIEKLYAAGIR